jgi:hypothetical protein
MRDFLPDSVNRIPMQVGRVSEDSAEEIEVAAKRGSDEMRRPDWDGQQPSCAPSLD